MRKMSDRGYANYKREYGKLNVKNNVGRIVESKTEVHIHKNRAICFNLKDTLLELMKIGERFKKSTAAIIITGILVCSVRIKLQPSVNINDKVSYDCENQSVTTTYEGWNSLKFVTRDEWIAEPPRSELDKIKHPVPQVVITHTASDACTARSKCVFLVRQMQNFHTEGRVWSDIGYNFLVGGDGYVYIGRGWDHVGAFAKGFNSVSIGIAMIGTFVTQQPTEKQFAAVKMLINEGIHLKKLSPNYKLLAHCNVSSTTSPGLMVYNEINTWPHFSETPL